MDKNSLKYRNRVLIYIDVLGFKNMIEGKEPKKEFQIIQVLDKLRDYANHNSKSMVDAKVYNNYNIPPDRQVTQFSDSIVISFSPKTKDELFYTLLSILMLQVELCFSGVLIRGGISVDMAIHTKEYLFGKAMDKSWLLAEKCAVYPRIIIRDNTIRYCAKYYKEENLQQKETTRIKSILKKDSDGFYYLDYVSLNKIITKDNTNHKKYLNSIKTIISTEIKNSDLSVKQKYMWLRDKYDVAIKEINN